MDEALDGMMTLDRQPDPVFANDEDLYRRIDSNDLEGGRVSLDAVELPDMSVNRSKYGPPEWARRQDEFRSWGVFAFQVQDIPAELLHLGTILFTFGPQHVPLKYNYPHSEIWAFKNGEHIDLRKRSDLDPDLHLRWRQILVWKCRMVLQPE